MLGTAIDIAIAQVLAVLRTKQSWRDQRPR
jgi:hypothetical protein